MNKFAVALVAIFSFCINSCSFSNRKTIHPSTQIEISSTDVVIPLKNDIKIEEGTMVGPSMPSELPVQVKIILFLSEFDQARNLKIYKCLSEVESKEIISWIGFHESIYYLVLLISKINPNSISWEFYKRKLVDKNSSGKQWLELIQGIVGKDKGKEFGDNLVLAMHNKNINSLQYYKSNEIFEHLSGAKNLTSISSTLLSPLGKDILQNILKNKRDNEKYIALVGYSPLLPSELLIDEHLLGNYNKTYAYLKKNKDEADGYFDFTESEEENSCVRFKGYLNNMLDKWKK